MTPDEARLKELLAGATNALRVGGAGDDQNQDSPLLVFPGAFNPLHDGHRRMAQIAAEMCGRGVNYELSILNVDKRPLERSAIVHRAAQFQPHESIWLTRAATFVEKSQLFAGATFVVGADTAQRIADARYYNDCERKRDDAIAAIADRGCKFLVFGRHTNERFTELADVTMPAALQSICRGVPASVFRFDVSSTQLRESPPGDGQP